MRKIFCSNTILFLILFGLSTQVEAQTLKYDALRKGKTVGEMVVTRNVNGDTQDFSVKSSFTFRVLMSFKVDFINEEKFIGTMLESGMVRNRLIGISDNEANIQRNNGEYNLQINGVRTPVEEKEIDYTVSKIYTQEPYDGQKVYTQYYGKFLDFEKVGDHQYRFESPDGYNYYTYEYGICTAVKVERRVGTVEFRLQPESLAAVKSNAAVYQSK